MPSPVDPFHGQIRVVRPRYLRHSFARAVEVLATIEQSGRYGDKVLDEYFRANKQLGSSDRALISDVVYASLRWWRRADAALFSADWRPSAETAHAARAAVMLVAAGYEPDAVIEAAELSGDVPLDGCAMGFLALDPHDAGTTEDLASRASLPPWIADRLADTYGWPRVGDILVASRDRAPVTIRANTLERSRDDLLRELTAAGFDATPTPVSPWGITVERSGELRNSPLFRDGSFDFQDEGSQLVALLTGAEPGMTVADACAGAGGKTLALGAMMENDGTLLAVDISAPKLHEMTRRADRAGVRIVETAVACSTRRLRRWRETADRVLLDAPCSGSGTWRRIPDGPEHLKEEGLARFARKQHEILSDYADLTKPGGRLIYATCSIFHEENAGVVTRWLDRNPEYSIVPVGDLLPPAVPAEAVVNGFLQLTPELLRTDGFFAAVLERRSA